MSEYFPKPKYLEGNVKVELDFCNYATKTDLNMQHVLIPQILLIYFISYLM